MSINAYSYHTYMGKHGCHELKGSILSWQGKVQAYVLGKGLDLAHRPPQLIRNRLNT